MEDKKDYTISHTATRHQESYVIRFDHKEFFVAVKECRKHHKDYDEMTEFEIVQMVHPYDTQKISEIMSKLLKEAKTSNSEPKGSKTNKDLEVSATPTPKESQKAIPSLNPDIMFNKKLNLMEIKNGY